MKRWVSRWLARLIAPDICDEAERYRWLRMELGLTYRWMGEFPEINALLERFQAMELQRYRALDGPLPKYSRWNGDISGFREQLRRKEHLTAPAE